MAKMTLPQSTEPRTCECGTPIHPYVMGNSTYYAVKCVTCLELDRREEERRKQDDKLASLGLQRRYRASDFDNLQDPKPPEHVIESIRMYAIEIAAETEPSSLWGVVTP
jgi:hypothetical protein